MISSIFACLLTGIAWVDNAERSSFFWIVLVLLVGILLCLILAMLIPNRGGSGDYSSAWYLLLFLLGPVGIVAAIILIVRREEARKAIQNQRDAIRDLLNRGSLRPCPHCAEIIKGEAKVCRYCGRDVPTPIGKTNVNDING